MEPATKQIKLEKVKDETIKAAVVGNEPQFETEFLDMNDDCILAICEHLKLDDLYSMGSTCVRINELAGDCFQRKFPNEWIDVNYKRDKTIVFDHPNNNAQNHFGKYFRSIRVTAGIPIGIQQMFKFIESKCCNELNHLELIKFYGELNEEHGTLFASKLINLKSIKITKFHVDGDIYGVILQHCKNIESLSIHTVLAHDTDWMVQSYPMLTNLNITLDDKFHREEFKRSIKEFTNKNSQLQTIECAQVDVIRAIVSSEIKVPCLKFKFETGKDLNMIYYDLKMACDNEKIDQLELFTMDQQWTSIHDLADLKPLSVLYNIHYRNEHRLLSIQRMTNLRCLKLNLGNVDDGMIELVTMLSKHPKLVELHLVWDTLNIRNFCDFVLPIVQNSAKMTTVWLEPRHRYLIPAVWRLNSLKQLNLARTLVSGAVPLTIHIRQHIKGFSAYKKGYTTMLKNIPVGDMVKIQLHTWQKGKCM